MDAAKVRLSKEERTLVMNPDWILTKNSIMGKVGVLFAELSEQLQATNSLPTHHPITEHLPPNWSTPKISKGENYRGLPWVVLDYPRAFGREDVLAIRTLFWWGHYFSVTLHLKGKYKDLYLPVIRERIVPLGEAGFHISVSDDEWRHELDSDNYLPLQGDMDAGILKERAFLKLSAKCGLDKWDDAGSVLLELYGVLAEVIAQATS
jgi:hypothetical protein